MTYQEALDSLRYEIDEEGHCSYIEDEIHIAMKALEMQIPKKPKDHPLSDGQCPSCNAVFDYDWKPKSKYCQNCGQALDWGDTDDR